MDQLAAVRQVTVLLNFNEPPRCIDLTGIRDQYCRSVRERIHFCNTAGQQKFAVGQRVNIGIEFERDRLRAEKVEFFIPRTPNIPTQASS